ncbi:MAG: AAA family ATPase [Fimbriimonadaceae bacterium]|nr:MAG: AAA family ATPase [Fimbriimonadaceae bacterium]
MTILIAGGSCSGKSTIARALAEAIPGATHIPLDQFFRRDDPKGPQIEVNGELVFDCNHPETIDLQAALQAIQNTPEPRIIDSHFGLFYAELRELATLKVFVDCPDDIRAIRRILRDSPGRGTPQEVADYYLICARPAYTQYIEPTRHFADVVSDGNRPTEQLLAHIANALEFF